MAIYRIITPPIAVKPFNQGEQLTDTLYGEYVQAARYLSQIGVKIAGGAGISFNKLNRPFCGDYGSNFTEQSSKVIDLPFELTGGFDKYWLMARIRTKNSGGNEQNIKWEMTANGVTETLVHAYHTGGTGSAINTNSSNDYWLHEFGSLSAGILTFPGTDTVGGKITVTVSKSNPGAVTGAGVPYFDGLWNFSLYLYR